MDVDIDKARGHNESFDIDHLRGTAGVDLTHLSDSISIDPYIGTAGGPAGTVDDSSTSKYVCHRMNLPEWTARTK